MESFANFQVGAFIIQVINLLIIVFILRKFVFKPFLSYVVDQEVKQQQIDSASDTIAIIRESAEKEANKVMTDANAQAFEIRNNAKNVAQDHATRIIAEAEEKAAFIQRKAQEDIDATTKKVRQELQGEVLRLALSINQKLFKGRSQANSDFIKSHM